MKGKQKQTSKSSTWIYYYKYWQRRVISTHTDFRENTQKGFDKTGVLFLEEGEIYTFNKQCEDLLCARNYERCEVNSLKWRQPCPHWVYSLWPFYSKYGPWNNSVKHHLYFFFFCFYNIGNLRRTSLGIHTLNITQIWMTMHNEILRDPFSLSHYPSSCLSFLIQFLLEPFIISNWLHSASIIILPCHLQTRVIINSHRVL